MTAEPPVKKHIPNADANIVAEIAAGRGISLIELARQHGVNPSTAFRWVSRGLPAGDGTRVRLKALQRGKRWLTTAAAVARFFGSLPISAPQPTTGPVRTPARRQRDTARARNALKERYGI
jgi:transposase-like protein